MIPGSVQIQWHGIGMVLMPDRAVWLPDERALLVADVHLGKPASFRSFGLPVPESVTGADLSRLSALLGVTGARRLIVLGDLIHDSVALRERTAAAVLAWSRSLGDVKVELIPGNHDRKAASCLGLGVSVLADVVELGGLRLTHEPPANPLGATLCGHLHPAVSVGRPGSPGRVRSACFWFEGKTGILPAFGGFTGGLAMRVREDAGVFAAGDRAVVAVTGLARGWVRADGCRAGAEAYDRA